MLVRLSFELWAQGGPKHVETETFVFVFRRTVVRVRHVPGLPYGPARACRHTSTASRVRSTASVLLSTAGISVLPGPVVQLRIQVLWGRRTSSQVTSSPPQSRARITSVVAPVFICGRGGILRQRRMRLWRARLGSTAERVGFEPTVPCGTLVFKTSAIDQLCHLSALEPSFQ